jgi:hypothetical protein
MCRFQRMLTLFLDWIVFVLLKKTNVYVTHISRISTEPVKNKRRGKNH